MKTLEQKYKKDRVEYESLCKLNGIYGMLESVDWYWHFNELKRKPVYFCNWDDSDWWTIMKNDKVWLCIEGGQDDGRANEIVNALNKPSTPSPNE